MKKGTGEEVAWHACMIFTGDGSGKKCTINGGLVVQVQIWGIYYANGLFSPSASSLGHEFGFRLLLFLEGYLIWLIS